MTTVIGTYDLQLVALSISLACLASYAALDLGGRIRGSLGWARRIWLVTAAIAMGGGIWSMHFVGMLAFIMPMRVSYDLDLTVLSLLVAIAVTGFGFFMIGVRRVGELEFALSGIIMGIGIVAMHYIGMAAMRMPADIRYDPALVALSILIAIAASIAALRLAFRTSIASQRLLSALVMGAAISGMHYTGMLAATFTADPSMDGVQLAPVLAPTDLALAIATTTFVILVLALAAAAFDRKLMRRSLELEETNHRLRQAHDELVAVYEQGMFAGHCAPDGRIVHANRAFVENLGFTHADVIDRPLWQGAWWPDQGTRERVRTAFESAAAGTPFRGDLGYVTRDGTAHVTDIAFVPIKDEAGRVVSVFFPGMDITDRVRQYRATFENAGVGIAHLTPDIRWLRVNRTFADIVGYSPEELLGMSVQDLTHPDDLEMSAAAIARVRTGKLDGYQLEKRYVRKDGTLVWVHITGTVVRRSDGAVDYWVAVVQDISERRRAEEQVRLLLGEMNHRSKNILALIQAVARQTMSSSPEHFMDRFTDRIQAIAANQDLLVRTNWRGVEIKPLVEAQLAHFSDLVGHRITVDGPALRLSGAAAQAVGMALHELATNAGKYGALSTDAGRVDIVWSLDGDVLAMLWTERGGPKVTPPVHRGFGTTVMEAMVKQAVHAEVELDYDPSGLTWRMTCPAANALDR